MVKKIRQCRACQSSLLLKIFDFNNLPLAGNFPKSKFEGDLFPLNLIKCQVCELIQTAESIPKTNIFKNYSYESRTSTHLVKHLNDLGDYINSFSKKAKILEIGSNDGILIQKLIKSGHKCLGVDPSDVSKKSAEINSWNLINDFFSNELAKKITKTHGKFNLVVSTNSFAHNDEIGSLASGIEEILEKGGYLLIEVQNGTLTLKKNQFDTIYHEHTCYFTKTSISNLLAKYNFEIVSINDLEIHNGSIRVLAKKIKKDSYSKKFKKDEEVNNYTSSFINNVKLNKITLTNLLYKEIRNGKKVAAYGASGRATILLNFYELNKKTINYIVDNSELKIGKFIPNSDIEIKDKKILLEDPPDIILITAWNYKKEIIEESRKKYNFKGSFIIPLPFVEIID